MLCLQEALPLKCDVGLLALSLYSWHILSSEMLCYVLHFFSEEKSAASIIFSADNLKRQVVHNDQLQELPVSADSIRVQASDA